MWDVLIIGLAVLLIFRLWKRSRLPDNFPPGPRKGLPFIGDALTVLPDTKEGFERLRQK